MFICPSLWFLHLAISILTVEKTGVQQQHPMPSLSSLATYATGNGSRLNESPSCWCWYTCGGKNGGIAWYGIESACSLGLLWLTNFWLSKKNHEINQSQARDWMKCLFNLGTWGCNGGSRFSLSFWCHPSRRFWGSNWCVRIDLCLAFWIDRFSKVIRMWLTILYSLATGCGQDIVNLMLLYRWARPQKHWGYTAINGSNIASTTYSVYYRIWNTAFFQFSKVNHEKWMHVGMFFEEGRSPFQPGHRQLLHHGFRGSMRYWFSRYIRILITRNHKRHTRVLLEVCRVPTKHLALFCFLIMKQYYITAYLLYKQTVMNCIRSQRQFSKKEITNFVTCIGILEAIGVLLIFGRSTANFE